MKLWRFSDPCDYTYARAGRVGGTWQDGEYDERRRPITVEWESGSDVVGDFTWPGLDTDVLTTDRPGGALTAAQVPGVVLRSVEMVENSEPAERRSKKPRVKLPYSGRQLWDPWVTAWTRVGRDRSTVREVEREDGTEHLEAVGVERREMTWDQQRMELVTVLQPRLEGQGLVVPATQGIFRVKEFPAWIFCTDDVKRLVEERGFTNVSFLEMGDVLEERPGH